MLSNKYFRHIFHTQLLLIFGKEPIILIELMTTFLRNIMQNLLKAASAT